MNLGNDDRTVSGSQAFAQLYIDLRCQEKRLYTDEEVAWLPDVAEDNVHKKEWDIRKGSCKQLIKYLGRKKRPLKIVEVGCGNGWLSYQLSQIPDANVVGIDVNLVELQQAERVFHSISNLSFLYGGLEDISRHEKFDLILFAASIQYFPSLFDIVETGLERLNDKGEIHIIDSRFYNEEEVEAARQRSRQYFENKGFGKMDAFYFHHSLKKLDGFNYTIIHDPNSILNKILKPKNPFHWICIKK